MNAQLDILELIEARKLRDEGMSLAANAQGQRWHDQAYAAIEAIARRQSHVHVDDVLRAGIPRPHHYNCWGSVWMRAIKNGVIQRSNQSRPCTVDRTKHSHVSPVYFSRIFDPRCVP